MCSPTDVCYTTSTTRQNTPDANSRRQRSEAPDLSTLRVIPPATTITHANTETDAHPSPKTLAAAQLGLRTTDRDQQHSLNGMRDLVYGPGRAHSPQYCVNSENTRIFQESAPNAFPPKSQTSSLFAATLPHNTRGHTNAKKFTFNNTMVSSSPALHSNDRNVTQQRNPSIANTFPDESNEFNHELMRNPKLPPPLMLSVDKRQYQQYEPTLKDSPSPRDVTQDRHLYKTSGTESQGTFNHSHQIDFHPVPRVSLSHMWPQTSYTPRSPHCGEIRQESSPISSASNSSVTSPDDWSSNNDGNNMMRDQPHSSPSTLRSQHYTNPPIYRQQHIRPRAPFNLKPRPNNTYQPPQKQFQGQAQYTPYWNQQTASYHNNSPASLQSNTTTHPHGTHHNRLSHPPLAPLPPPTNITGILPPPARTSPEILKTLLRKKACLYEPGTSRAITLLTWLVARRLALQYGYFSRQHLQSGVHAIVGDKISRGIITRTKVNRCMQVILNSCFYYIIPKPDGTEESGESFRRFFKNTVVDDTDLIKTLPEPWNDLEISEETMVDINCVSPVLAEMKDDEDDNGRSHCSGSKRQVLLCFNENVRCAEDVLRCHNDFIRDSAISANLLLTPEEWRSFYLCKDEKNTCTTPTKKGTTDDIYNSYLSFDMPADVEESLAFKENIADVGDGAGSDTLGQMTTSELVKFRTTWCCKRYEHDATLCRFAHIDVNKGWLRRNPTQFKYCAIMCPKTSIVNNKSSDIDGCYLNACEDGIRCKFAHSKEEVAYHSENYKTKVCQSTKKGSHCPCDMRDICPYLHPGGHSFCSSTPPRSLNRHIGRRMNDTPCRIKGHLIGGKHPTPSTGNTEVGSHARAGAPMLYLSPAPTSEFDKTLHFPGLCSLYRRNCATHYAHDVASEKTKYSNFGDNWVQTVPLPSVGKSVDNSFSLFGVI